MEPSTVASVSKTRARLNQMKDIAQKNNARLIILMAPASIQVCKPKDLSYFPRHVDLLNPKQFDIDKPQRQTDQIAKSLQIPFEDLRPALRAGTECPYQPRSMHWTELGHDLVSDFVAQRLLAPGQELFHSKRPGRARPAVPQCPRRTNRRRRPSKQYPIGAPGTDCFARR